MEYLINNTPVVYIVFLFAAILIAAKIHDAVIKHYLIKLEIDQITPYIRGWSEHEQNAFIKEQLKVKRKESALLRCHKIGNTLNQLLKEEVVESDTHTYQKLLEIHANLQHHSQHYLPLDISKPLKQALKTAQPPAAQMIRDHIVPIIKTGKKDEAKYRRCLGYFEGIQRYLW